MAKETMTEKLPSLVPSVVIVGRPNVGKSTLFNRITGTRRSIVTDEPGITRDRIYGRAAWHERAFELVDTGGMVPEDKASIPRELFAGRRRYRRSHRLVLVVDARAGVTRSTRTRASFPPLLASRSIWPPIKWIPLAFNTRGGCILRAGH